MSNPYFSFKKFTIYHDRCAMKVGTDGVLLGAWARIENAQRILDIGAGTGLISIMAGQRNSKAEITGIEINSEAAIQAQENAKASPWNERITILNKDVKEFHPENLFEAILSNPPYFSNALKCPNNERSTARHTNELSFDELMQSAASLLHPQGEFSIIIPATEVGQILRLAIENKLYPSRKTWIQTTPNASPKRCLMAFRFTTTERVEEDTLIIEKSRFEYSDEYRELTKEFYLKM